MKVVIVVGLAACGRVGFDPLADEASRLEAHEFGTCYARGPGDILCWGENNFGQVVEGVASPPIFLPTPAASIPDAVDYARSEISTCVVRGTGTVECWGNNDDGQLGDPGPTRVTRAPVPGLTDVVRLDAADFGVFALRASGDWVGWGSNDRGQLADGTLENQFAPTPLPMLAGATTIAADQVHACSVFTDGALYCWGQNDFGVLGIGTEQSPYPLPQRVVGGEGARAVATGIFHTCAIFADAKLYCWGLNNWEQLGTTGIEQSLLPLPVPGTEGIDEVIAGEDFTCMRRDGQVSCWGRVADFVLGATPVAIPNADRARHMVQGLRHVCFTRDPDDQVLCFGGGSSGQLGDGSAARLAAAPVTFPP